MVLFQLPAVLEFHAVQFNGAITGSAVNAQLGTRQLSAGLGFLWTGISIDPTSTEFTWKVSDQRGSVIDNEELVHGNTMGGQGTSGNAKNPSPLFRGKLAGHFFKGGSMIQVLITELSTSSNTLYFTMVGILVREPSRFHSDIMETLEYTKSPGRA